jgi:hypothetical protein
MKIKENFALKSVAGAFVVLPLAEATLDFNGMLSLNESGCMLWNLLKEGSTREELAKALTNEYSVGMDEALADVDEFIEKLNDAGCIDMQK